MDIKISRDRYSRDDERGVVRGVVFRDVRVLSGPCPPSLLQGFDGEHLVEDVAFENVVLPDGPAVDFESLRLIAEKTRGVRIG